MMKTIKQYPYAFTCLSIMILFLVGVFIYQKYMNISTSQKVKQKMAELLSEPLNIDELTEGFSGKIDKEDGSYYYIQALLEMSEQLTDKKSVKEKIEKVKNTECFDIFQSIPYAWVNYSNNDKEKNIMMLDTQKIDEFIKKGNEMPKNFSGEIIDALCGTALKIAWNRIEPDKRLSFGVTDYYSRIFSYYQARTKKQIELKQYDSAYDTIEKGFELIEHNWTPSLKKEGIISLRTMDVQRIKIMLEIMNIDKILKEEPKFNQKIYDKLKQAHIDYKKFVTKEAQEKAYKLFLITNTYAWDFAYGTKDTATLYHKMHYKPEEFKKYNVPLYEINQIQLSLLEHLEIIHANSMEEYEQLKITDKKLLPYGTFRRYNSSFLEDSFAPMIFKWNENDYVKMRLDQTIKTFEELKDAK